MARHLLLMVCVGTCILRLQGLSAEDHTFPDVIHVGPSETIRATKALDTLISVDLSEVPLRDLTALLGEKASVGVFLDEPAFESLGLDAGEPITFACKRMTLRAALSNMLRPLELEVKPMPIGLVVTSPGAAEAKLVTSVYPVGDVVGRGSRGADELLEAIEACVEPDGWEKVGGRGAMRFMDGTLIILQTEAAHCKVAAALRALRQFREGMRDQSLVAEYDAQVRSKLREALEEPIDETFHEIPLEEFVASLSARLSIPIYLDQLSLDDMGLDSTAPIYVAASKHRARIVLDGALKPLELRWLIQDEAVWITNANRAERALYNVLYPLNERRAGVLDDLHDTITGTIAPDSWVEVGGNGSMATLEEGRSLLVYQTHEVHEQLAELFEALNQAGEATPLQMSSTFRESDKAVELRVYCITNSSQPNAMLPPIDLADLKAKIKKHVDPTSWEAADHFIDCLPGRLLIQASRTVHLHLDRFLAQLQLPLVEPSRSGQGRPPRSGGVF